jgi:O-antigen/teichoic acid export membrane protein
MKIATPQTSLDDAAFDSQDVDDGAVGSNAIADSPQRPSYGSQARSAVVWNTGFNLFRDALQFVQMLVLARLLTPQAYGQFGFVTGVMGFLTVISARNFIAYTLQVKSDQEAHFQDQFTAASVLQLNVFVLANLVAIGLRWHEEFASAAQLLHVASLIFLLDPACEIRVRMLEREFNWKSLRLLHGAGLILCTLTAIAMAFLGAGAYALVFPGMLVTLPFTYDLFVRQGWRPTWKWSWQNYQRALSFGITRIGCGFAFFGRQLLETAVLAGTLGFGPLGIVNRAVGLSQMACGKLPMQLMTAVYPILTRLETASGHAGNAGDLLLRFVGWVTIPIATCLSVLAVPVIRVAYGNQWLDAAPLLSWALAWVISAGMMQMASYLVLARQRATVCTIADTLALVGTAACLWLLLPRGLIAYFAGLIIVYQAILWGLVVVLHRESAVTRRGVWLAVGPPAIVSLAIAGGATYLCRMLGVRIDTFWPAAAWGICFSMGYVGALRVAFVRPLTEMVKQFPGNTIVSRLIRLPA